MNLTDKEKVEKFEEIASQIKNLRSYKASLQGIINDGAASTVFRRVWEYGDGYNITPVVKRMPPEKIKGILEEIERMNLVISFFESILYGSQYTQSLEMNETFGEKTIERTIPYEKKVEDTFPNENSPDATDN